MTVERRDVIPGRSVQELRQLRLDGMAAWQDSVRRRELQEAERKDNRQASTEARRRLEALRRTNAALLTRSEAAAVESLRIMDRLPPRAVVVHRLDWMRGQLAKGLTGHGVEVLATEHDGADGLGVTIAEQPDLLVVEDRLPSVRAEELVHSLREFAPLTVVAAQVEHDSDAEAMLAAGARAVFHRRIPPASVCEQLAALLRDRPTEALILV